MSAARLLSALCAIVLATVQGPGVQQQVWGTSAAASDELVFTVRTLSQARNKAGTERLVLVFLTQQGDADCAFMEAEAWTHPDVETWVADHAVAARVDAKSFHGASLKGQYGVEELPALLAFRGERLARQHEGPLDGGKLLAWLEVVRIGDVQAADLVLAQPSGGQRQTREDIVDVDGLMLDAMNAKNPSAAVSALLAGWRDTVGTPQQDPRRPRLLDALGPYLINEDARALVERERDAAWSRHRKHKALPDLVDWLSLNHLLEVDSLSVEWVRSARADKRGSEWVRRVLYHPQDPLLDVLAKRKDWTTIGRSIGDPIELIDMRRRVHRETKITITGAESAADRDALQRQLSTIVVGLLADGRDKEAKDASDHVVSADRDAGPVLVRMAIDAEEPRRWMRGLLNANKTEQVTLALELTQALQMR